MAVKASAASCFDKRNTKSFASHPPWHCNFQPYPNPRSPLPYNQPTRHPPPQPSPAAAAALPDDDEGDEIGESILKLLLFIPKLVLAGFTCKAKDRLLLDGERMVFAGFTSKAKERVVLPDSPPWWRWGNLSPWVGSADNEPFELGCPKSQPAITGSTQSCGFGGVALNFLKPCYCVVPIYPFHVVPSSSNSSSPAFLRPSPSRGSVFVLCWWELPS